MDPSLSPLWGYYEEHCHELTNTFLYGHVFNSLIRLEELGYVGTEFNSEREPAHTATIMLHGCTFPPAADKGFNFSKSSITLVTVYLLDTTLGGVKRTLATMYLFDNHPSRCKVQTRGTTRDLKQY